MFDLHDDGSFVLRLTGRSGGMSDNEKTPNGTPECTKKVTPKKDFGHVDRAMGPDECEAEACRLLENLLNRVKEDKAHDHSTGWEKR